jgi:hypothetical protein
MFRTRDYALILATITFLVVGITTTVLTKGGLPGMGGMSATVFESSPEVESYETIVPEDAPLAREDRIKSLREKIARLGLGDEEPAPVAEVATALPEVSEEEADNITEQKCSYYGAYAGGWNPRGLIIEEAEGARLVYREVEGEAVGSSTVPVTQKEIVVQLPLRSAPMPSSHCIPSDVIGIATDGSLIRNSEVGVYSVFGAGTLVGYALDGFPIYGASSGASDICGGSVVAGQYRYHINTERDTILACFGGVPASL